VARARANIIAPNTVGGEMLGGSAHLKANVWEVLQGMREVFGAASEILEAVV
jgi:hypothetical protein